MLFERQPHARPRQVRPDDSIAWRRRAIEQHVFDADMVMKPLQVAKPRRGTGGVQMDGGSAMTGQIDMVRLAQRGHLQKRRLRHHTALMSACCTSIAPAFNIRRK